MGNLFAQYEKNADALDSRKIKLEVSEVTPVIAMMELRRFLDSRLVPISRKGTQLTQARIEKENLIEDKDYKLVPERSDMPIVEALRQLAKYYIATPDIDQKIELDIPENSLVVIMTQLDRMIESTAEYQDKDGNKVLRNQLAYLEVGKDYKKVITKTDLFFALEDFSNGIEEFFEEVDKELVTSDEVLKEEIDTGEKNVITGNTPKLVE